MAKMSLNELAAAIKTDNPDYKDIDNTQLVNAFVSDNPEYKQHVIETKEPWGISGPSQISEAPGKLQQFTQDVKRNMQVGLQSLLNPVLQPIQKAIGAEPAIPMTTGERQLSEVAGGVRNLASAELGGAVTSKLGGGILAGITGGATTGALQPVEKVEGLNATERGKNIATGAVAGGALTGILKGLTAFRNIRNVDKVLYPKAEKEISTAYKTMHKNIESDLKALPETFPGRTINLENTYDEVAKYVTADKKVLGIIKEIPELKAMLRTKVPIQINTPFEAQMLKNKITNKLSEAAKNGTISAKEYQSAKLAQAMDNDIIQAYPEKYPEIKSVYDKAKELLDILEPLRDRAGFKSALVGGASKGKGQAMQTAISSVLPKDLAKELINYANTAKNVPHIVTALEKNIKPRNVKPALKRVIK